MVKLGVKYLILTMKKDIVKKIVNWYPLNYRKGHKNWYTDQLKLKKYISRFDKKFKK